MTRLRVFHGDLVEQAVDALVNAANESLLGGGGVDGAIHRAAGPELLAFTRGLGGCPCGQARLSPGFRLRAPQVIHTVGPVWRGGTRGEAELLASCYRSVYALAREQGLGSLAFPAISCGVYGYPLLPACRIAARETRRAGSALEEIRFVAYDAAALEAFLEAFTEVFGAGVEAPEGRIWETFLGQD